MYPRTPKASAPISPPNVDRRYNDGEDKGSEARELKRLLEAAGAYTSSTARPKTPVLRDHRNPHTPPRSETPKRERSITRPRYQQSSYPRPTLFVMLLLPAAVFLYIVSFANGSYGVSRNAKLAARQESCPDYKTYSARPHPPYTSGPHALPFQRPAPECRLFQSQAVDDLIQEMVGKMADPDLARLFENAYPNTLDTTVRWHIKGGAEEAQSFIVTGDINAQWLRDCKSGCNSMWNYTTGRRLMM